MKIRTSLTSLGFVFGLLSLSNCAINPVTGKKQLVLMSEKREIAMGKESDPQVMAFFGSYNDPNLQRFINEKGQEMVKASHRSKLAYEFKIVDSPVINAFATPGGYVYFTRGIMAHFNNEAEFAGVLGQMVVQTLRRSNRTHDQQPVS
jgi:predicted Zn-dependent protease